MTRNTTESDRRNDTQATTTNNTMPATIVINRADLIEAYQNNTKSASQYQVRVRENGSTDILTPAAHEIQNEVTRIPPRRFVFDDTDPAEIDTDDSEAVSVWCDAIVLKDKIRNPDSGDSGEITIMEEADE